MIPKPILQDALLAVQDLRRKYLDQPQITRFAGSSQIEKCPLCNFAMETFGWHQCAVQGGENEECCPWFWFGEYSCTRSQYEDHPMNRRLERLDNWENLINEELQERKE